MMLMKLVLLGVIVALCNAKVAQKRSLVVTTEASTTALSSDKTTIENKSHGPPKIYEMRVETNVSNRYARTLVTSKVKNRDTQAQEATFSVVTPDKAFISGFVMEIDGKRYEAYVQEKEEAKQTYDQAVAHGQGAAHVAVSARDSHRFTVSVNIEPESKAIFYLTYEELLARREDKYEIVLNIHPGQLVDMHVQVNISESRPLKFVRAAPLRSGNEVSKNSTTVDPEATVDQVNSTFATVTFNPDKAKQQLLATGLGGKEENGLSGQFVVEYDVARDPQGGEVLVDGGYFVHFFAPEELTPLKKQVIFVLDTSGSMYGTRISQLKEAMNSILGELKPEDTFSIVEFNSKVSVWNVPLIKPTYHVGEDAYYFYRESTATPKEAVEQVLPPSFEATPDNVNKSKQVVSQFGANGGTDIQTALKVGLEIVDKYRDKKGRQPIIVFLTDGEPTVGITSIDKIIATISELNTHKVPIFSLSFGSGADKEFLRKISLNNLGFARHIYEAADAYLQLENFYKQISSPLLSNVTFKYVDKVSNVTKKQFPIFFQGGEIYAAGVLDTSDFQPPQVEAWGVDGPIVLTPKVYKATGSLERLWAYLTVKQILDQREIIDDTENKEKLTKQALNLALKYSFVTDVSSLVVVKPNETSKAQGLEDAAQPPSFGPYGNIAPLSLSGVAAPQYAFASASYAAVPHFSKSYNRRPVAHFFRSTPVYYPALAPQPLGPSPAFDVGVSYDRVDIVSISNTESTAADFQTAPSNIFTELPWLQGSLDVNNTITLNNDVYYLGLDKSGIQGDSCLSTISNQNGTCTLISECPSIYPHLNSLDDVKKFFCKLESNYAGVCCPTDGSFTVPLP